MVIEEKLFQFKAPEKKRERRKNKMTYRFCLKTCFNFLNGRSDYTMKMLRHVYRAITLAIFLAIFIAICVRPGSADFYHDVMACQIICTDQTVALGGKLSRVDILYPGTPQQGIFMSVTLFPPFTHYETDGKTYLRIYPDAPIGLSDPPYEIKVVTFKTILDW